MDGLALFPTPLFRFQTADEPLISEVASACLAERTRSDGIRASNCGGAWHSTPDLGQRQERVWQQAAEVIAVHCQRSFHQLAAAGGHSRPDGLSLSLQMWAMVMDAGGYSELHGHHGSDWSAVWYVDAGDDSSERGGQISFVDPRGIPSFSGGVAVYRPVFSVKPETGMLLVFPGWLQHHVHPYTGKTARVALSGNVSFRSNS